MFIHLTPPAPASPDPQPPPEIRYVLRAVADALREAGSPTARLDAEVLLAHVLGISRAQLYARLRAPWPPDVLEAYGAALRRRLAGEPVAYIIGHKDFYGLDLLVDARVLIPRPETEELVGAVLAAVPRDSVATIVDVGTGSGAIAIALAIHRPRLQVIGLDISLEALEVARLNAARCGLDERISWLQSDLLAQMAGPVQGIVANLPYTLLDEVEPGVRDWEPTLALIGGGVLGADVIMRLLGDAPRVLGAGGFVALEIGYNQGAAVRDTAQAAFPQAVVRLQADLAGQDRIVWIQEEGDHAG